MFILFSLLSWASASLLSPGDHCVAYKTEKKVFLVSSVPVVGKNCDVSSQIIPYVGGTYAFEMNVPVNGFRSGQADQDRDMVKILKGDVESDIVFRSTPMTPEDWKAKIKDGRFPIKGELEIGKEKFPVEAVVNVAKAEKGLEADGVIKTTFKDFKIDPPQVAGGIMASVKQDVEIHFHVLAQRTMGMDSITQ